MSPAEITPIQSFSQTFVSAAKWRPGMERAKGELNHLSLTETAVTSL
jgi:hypothetical protein